MVISMKEVTLRREEQFLCDKAFFSKNTAGRLFPVDPCPVRTEFQRDRDRITHCKSFRRLMHKMQVFLAPEGDHYRTRLTHTLEVTQIARTLARALCLNEDLAEAGALGHDLGHTPFGHSGERALDEICDGGFRHYEQSLRVVDKLEKNGEGLNLTHEVRDAILNHSGSGKPSTFEGKLLLYADRIAYINHDIDDACRAGILTNDDIPSYISDVLGKTHSDRITTLVSAVIDHGVENGIGMSEPYGSLMNDLRTFMFQRVYTHPIAKSEDDKVMQMIAFLYTHFCHNPDSIPGEYRKYIETDGVSRVAADYIAGMTDRFAIGCFEELFVPRVWSYK
ncbi:MAG: deoxyguanosinetriphosphate triphosphohydrolase [Clostridia bacterium]|nr:deoxyguanosinetriphosphate triphosphohydrolase [Clostridia bacterium]